MRIYEKSDISANYTPGGNKGIHSEYLSPWFDLRMRWLSFKYSDLLGTLIFTTCLDHKEVVSDSVKSKMAALLRVVLLSVLIVAMQCASWVQEMESKWSFISLGFKKRISTRIVCSWKMVWLYTFELECHLAPLY